MDLIYGMPVLLVVVVTWQGIGSFLGNYYLARVSLGLIDDLRRALFDSLLRLPNGYFDQQNSGHLISRITYNVTMVTGAATDAIKVVIREGMTVIFLFGYLLWMNWRLTLVMVAILPIIGLMVTRASRKFRKQSRKIQVAMGDLTHVASETIQGYRVVRSFGGEDYESARFRAASADNTPSSCAWSERAQLHAGAAVRHLQPMAVLLVWCCGCAATPRPATWSPTSPPPGCCPSRFASCPKSARRFRRGWPAPRASFPRSTKSRNPIRGTIEKESVSGRLEVKATCPSPIRAAAQRVLDQISFSVEPGQMIALVGRSGSGKSTLANLIPRFYHHDSGQILIDGVDVEDYTLRNLRQAHRAGHPAGDPVQRHASPATSPTATWPTRRARRSKRPPRPPLPASSSTACRTASTPWSARTASCCRVAAAAPGDCPGAAQGCADPDPRRGDLGARHRVRTPHPERPRPGDGRADDAGHRAPPVDHRKSRPDPGHGPGTHRRARQPRRVAGRQRPLRAPARHAVQRARRQHVPAQPDRQPPARPSGPLAQRGVSSRG
jgi:hypothetical protein